MSTNKLLGWRASNADETLYFTLFSFGYMESMHLIPYKEVTSRWATFVDKLFGNDEQGPNHIIGQAGFDGQKKISAKSVKEQWTQRIAKFKSDFGWDGGKCNKSGREGGLNEVEKIIQDILIEQEEADELKKLKSNERLLNDAAETTLLMESLSKESTIKRKTLDSTGSSNDPTNPPTPKPQPKDELDIFQQTLLNISNDSDPSLKKLRVSLESDIETKLNLLYPSTPQGLEQLFEACHYPLMHQHEEAQKVLLLNEVGLDVIISIYCSPGKNFDVVYVKEQFTACGIKPMYVHKIYKALNDAKNQLIKDTE